MGILNRILMALFSITGNAAPAGQSILPDNLVAAFAPSGAPDRMAVRTGPSADGRFKTVLTADILKPADNSWDLQVRVVTTAPVAAGDVLHFSCWIRCTRSRQETGEGFAQFVFETAVEPWDKELQRDVTAGHEWRLIEVPFRSGRGFPAGKGSLAIRLGAQEQTIEVAGLKLVNYGSKVKLESLPRTRVTYQGMEPAAEWRKMAAERIRKNRMAEMKIQVLDPDGRPVKKARVHVRMIRHAYHWGSEVSLKYILDKAETPDGVRFREWIPKLFNIAVEGGVFKWDAWEGQWGPSYTPKSGQATVTWLREQGLDVRGHVLVWPSWGHVPKSVKSLEKDPAALRKRVLDHIREEAGMMRGQMCQWDVINEPFDNHDLIDILGREAMVDWFKEARSADPGATLFLNDYTLLSGGGGDTVHRRHFDATVKYLLDHGAPLGALGLQGHFGTMPTAPEDMLALLDRYASHGLPLYITEFDQITEDEELQGRFFRDLLTVFFSHPATAGFLMWGFWDGAHWKDNSPIFRRDWSLKPAGQAWMDLVLKEWWTDATVTTGADGRAAVQGFLGRYEVTAEGRTVTIDLAKSGAEVEVKP
jgi:GH35 family endo-1,4-beta-xylanase